jgi:hypothetical protein
MDVVVVFVSKQNRKYIQKFVLSFFSEDTSIDIHQRVLKGSLSSFSLIQQLAWRNSLLMVSFFPDSGTVLLPLSTRLCWWSHKWCMFTDFFSNNGTFFWVIKKRGSSLQVSSYSTAGLLHLPLFQELFTGFSPHGRLIRCWLGESIHLTIQRAGDPQRHDRNGHRLAKGIKVGNSVFASSWVTCSNNYLSKPLMSLVSCVPGALSQIK